MLKKVGKQVHRFEQGTWKIGGQEYHPSDVLNAGAAFTQDIASLVKNVNMKNNLNRAIGNLGIQNILELPSQNIPNLYRKLPDIKFKAPKSQSSTDIGEESLTVYGESYEDDPASASQQSDSQEGKTSNQGNPAYNIHSTKYGKRSHAEGGHLASFGMSNITGATNLLTQSISNYKTNSRIQDTTALRQAIHGVANTQYGGTPEQILAQREATPQLGHVYWKSLLNGSDKLDAGDYLGALSGAASGAAALSGVFDNGGKMTTQELAEKIKERSLAQNNNHKHFAGTALAVGAAVGALASLLGSGIGKHEANEAAKRESSLLNAGADEANYRTQLAYEDALDRADKMNFRNQLTAYNSMNSGIGTGYSNLLGNYAFAEGGETGNHGATWDNGLNYFGTGGTHEENPNEGIPQGIAPDGKPNLVEEGEYKWDDPSGKYGEYIFSNRLKVSNDMRKRYKLGKKDRTYAEAITKFMKTNNYDDGNKLDPYSQKTLDQFLLDLANDQEEQRTQKEMNDLMKAIKQLSPEEQQQALTIMEQALVQQAQGQQNPQQGVPQQQVPQQVQPGQPTEQIPSQDQMMATQQQQLPPEAYQMATQEAAPEEYAAQEQQIPEEQLAAALGGRIPRNLYLGKQYAEGGEMEGEVPTDMEEGLPSMENPEENIPVDATPTEEDLNQAAGIPQSDEEIEQATQEEAQEREMPDFLNSQESPEDMSTKELNNIIKEIISYAKDTKDRALAREARKVLSSDRNTKIQFVSEVIEDLNMEYAEENTENEDMGQRPTSEESQMMPQETQQELNQQFAEGGNMTDIQSAQIAQAPAEQMPTRAPEVEQDVVAQQIDQQIEQLINYAKSTNNRALLVGAIEAQKNPDLAYKQKFLQWAEQLIQYDQQAKEENLNAESARANSEMQAQLAQDQNAQDQAWQEQQQQQLPPEEQELVEQEQRAFGGRLANKYSEGGFLDEGVQSSNLTRIQLVNFLKARGVSLNKFLKEYNKQASENNKLTHDEEAAYRAADNDSRYIGNALNDYVYMLEIDRAKKAIQKALPKQYKIGEDQLNTLALKLVQDKQESPDIYYKTSNKSRKYLHNWLNFTLRSGNLPEGYTEQAIPTDGELTQSIANSYQPVYTSENEGRYIPVSQKDNKWVASHEELQGYLGNIPQEATSDYSRAPLYTKGDSEEQLQDKYRKFWEKHLKAIFYPGKKEDKINDKDFSRKRLTGKQYRTLISNLKKEATSTDNNIPQEEKTLAGHLAQYLTEKALDKGNNQNLNIEKDAWKFAWEKHGKKETIIEQPSKDFIDQKGPNASQSSVNNEWGRLHWISPDKLGYKQNSYSDNLVLIDDGNNSKLVRVNTDSMPEFEKYFEKTGDAVENPELFNGQKGIKTTTYKPKASSQNLLQLTDADGKIHYYTIPTAEEASKYQHSPAIDVTKVGTNTYRIYHPKDDILDGTGNDSTSNGFSIQDGIDLVNGLANVGIDLFGKGPKPINAEMGIVGRQAPVMGAPQIGNYVAPYIMTTEPNREREMTLGEIAAAGLNSPNVRPIRNIFYEAEGDRLNKQKQALYATQIAALQNAWNNNREVDKANAEFAQQAAAGQLDTWKAKQTLDAQALKDLDETDASVQNYYLARQDQARSNIMSPIERAYYNYVLSQIPK